LSHSSNAEHLSGVFLYKKSKKSKKSSEYLCRLAIDIFKGIYYYVCIGVHCSIGYVRRRLRETSFGAHKKHSMFLEAIHCEPFFTEKDFCLIQEKSLFPSTKEKLYGSKCRFCLVFDNRIVVQ